MTEEPFKLWALYGPQCYGLQHNFSTSIKLNTRWKGNSSWKNSKATEFQKNLIKCCIVDYKNVQITYWNTIINCESIYTVLNTWPKEHNWMFKIYLPTACTNGLPIPPTWNLQRFHTALAHKLLKILQYK